jgi:hypothetical protein
MHILITTNNFWVGGRETYIANYLGFLKRQGFTASLITSSIYKNTPETLFFDNIIVCGTNEYSLRWRNWLINYEKYIHHLKPSLIWAHHFDLFPAWLISRLYQIPLLTTFHGPLIGVDRPNDPIQALGMTLSIHRGDAISGVSKEIVSGIERLKQGIKKVHLIPNSVELSSAAWRSLDISKPKNFLLITRPDKLEHSRTALLFFNTYRKKVNGCSLTIAGGSTPNDTGDNDRNEVFNLVSKVKFAIKYLGGKWIYEQGPHFLRSLVRTNFSGYIAYPRDFIRKSDVVLGMGRVLLEGLAEGKPSVLIGYDNICGLVSPESFEKYRWSNFSGRGVKSQTAEKVCNSLLDFCKNDKTLTGEHLDLISLSKCSKKLLEIMEETVCSFDIKVNDINQAKELSKNIKSKNFDSSDIFSFVCSKLTIRELSSLYNLSIG